MRAGWATAVSLAAVVAAFCVPRPAQAAGASIALTVTGGGAVKFTSSDNTSAALAAGAPLTASVTVTTKVGGAGQIWIDSPANLIGLGGATLDLSLVTVTCADTGASGWFHGSTVTLVAGGSSGLCATIDQKINNKTTTFTVTFTLDARTPLADTWSATPGFSLGGTAF